VSRRATLALSLLWLLSLVPARVLAEVERFALIVGNNLGRAPHAALLYAESDASKVHAVLRELGGFAPLNMALLEGQDANTVRSTLIELNDRIRATAERGDDSVLFVYYSGHADARALELGGSELAITELARLVRGSSATFRLLVLDACRSGALTRVKGGTPRPPFELPHEARLSGQGLAFLTASSASEDAQESDEIRGSFFTHAFVSGLLGAADRNRDGLVVLEEAYRHAYDVTVRDTSRSLHGVQHPTFHYDLRGQDALVLTRLQGRASERAQLSFPREIAFLVLRDDANGAVLAELPAGSEARTLSLRPGRYFLRGRGEKFLLEGDLTLAAGETKQLEPRALERVEYARLVRKGAHGRSRSHALEAGAYLHSPTAGADAPCIGGSVGHALELAHLSVLTRLGICRSQLDNTFLRGATTEYELSAALLHPWDFRLVTMAAGLGVGALLAQQTFETAGTAPARLSLEPLLALVVMATSELTRRTFLRLEGRAETHFSRVQERAQAAAQIEAQFAARGTLTFGLFVR